ncbi:hypothetical protein P7C70_g9622, partial [Phenoliferia sp. Uapishka_3]
MSSLTALHSYEEIPCGPQLQPWAPFYNLQSAPLSSIPASVTSYTLHHPDLSHRFASTATLCSIVMRQLTAHPSVLPRLQTLAGVALDTSTIHPTTASDGQAKQKFENDSLLPPLLASRPALVVLPLAAHTCSRYPELEGWTL